MSSKPPPTDFPTLPFQTATAFATYLDENHLTAPGLYVKFAKKGSNIPSITTSEAVETALCYGWIDGRANSIDASYWTIRFTPRRSKSIWSQKNVKTIERLIEEGKMKPAGMAQVQAAKGDGRWERAYAGPRDMVIPKDLEELLQEDLKEYWEGLSKSKKYPYLHRLATASEKGREKRIEGVVADLRKAAGGTEKKSVSKAEVSKGRATKTPKSQVAVTKKKWKSNVDGDTSSTAHSGKETVRREGLRSARRGATGLI